MDGPSGGLGTRADGTVGPVPETPVSGTRTPSGLQWLGILAAVAVVVSIRLHTYSEPLERDITTYAVIGQELLRGRPLYSDLWDHKPPGVHVTYMLAVGLAGYGRNAVLLLGAGIALLTMAGVYAAGLGLGRGTGPAVWAAFFWGIVSSDTGLQANQPNTEVFLNACLVWAFVLLLPARAGWGSVAGAGILFALASLYKPTAVPAAFLISLAFILAGGRPRLRERLLKAGAMALIGASVWGGVLLWFRLGGQAGAFLDAVFLYNRDYVDQYFARALRAIHPGLLFGPMLKPVTPLVLLGLVGLLVGVQRNTRLWILLGCFFLAGLVQISILGGFFPHYYQVLLPVLAIAGGWSLGEIGWRFHRISRHLSLVAGACVSAFMLPYTANNFWDSPDEISKIKYSDPLFSMSVDLAKWLDRNHPEETFYEWGNETGLYFLSRKSPPSGVFYVYPLVSGPLRERLTVRVLEDLKRSPPDLFILNTQAVPEEGMEHPVLKWFSQGYEKLPGQDERNLFQIYGRKSGTDAF